MFSEWYTVGALGSACLLGFGLLTSTLGASLFDIQQLKVPRPKRLNRLPVVSIVIHAHSIEGVEHTLKTIRANRYKKIQVIIYTKQRAIQRHYQKTNILQRRVASARTTRGLHRVITGEYVLPISAGTKLDTHSLHTLVHIGQISQRPVVTQPILDQTFQINHTFVNIRQAVAVFGHKLAAVIGWRIPANRPNTLYPVSVFNNSTRHAYTYTDSARMIGSTKSEWSSAVFVGYGIVTALYSSVLYVAVRFQQPQYYFVVWASVSFLLACYILSRNACSMRTKVSQLLILPLFFNLVSLQLVQKILTMLYSLVVTRLRSTTTEA